MSKYLTVFTISWQNEFIYRANFILWRFRNILRFLMTYFLWNGVFLSGVTVFGYTQSSIFAYVFLILIVATIVFSSPSSDRIGAEIGNGDLSNYLVKPVSYIKYWFVRDLASKLLNLTFGVFEVGLLWVLLKPPIQISDNIFNIVGFIISVSIALVLYYAISKAVIFAAFWTPENTWGFAFLMLVIVDILAGGTFPLDILPSWLRIGLQFTPFPYLLYYPVAILIGKVQGLEIIRILVQSIIWLGVMYYMTSLIWKKGLKIYGAEGR